MKTFRHMFSINPEAIWRSLSAPFADIPSYVFRMSTFAENFSFRKLILIASLIIPSIYITGILSLSVLSGIDFNEVILYKYLPVHYALPGLVDYLIKPLTVSSGLLLIICFPGILFAPAFIRDKRNFSLVRFFSLGFALNIFLLFLGTTLLKLFGVVIDRFWLLIVILIGTLIGSLLLFRNSAFPTRYNFRKHKHIFAYLVLLFIIVVVFIAFFKDAVLRPLPVKFDYSQEAILGMDFTKISDFHEEFGMAHYLKSMLIPYWLINTLNKFGAYLYRPPLSFFINFFTVVLFGESYASLNFLSFIFTLGIFLFSYKIIYLGKEKKENLLINFGLGLFMFNFLLLLMRSDKRQDLPFNLSPDNCLAFVIQYLWVFLMMGVILFLFKKDIFLTCIFSILATLCIYESIPCVFILIVLYYFFFKEDRPFLKRFSKYYIVFLIIFCLYSLALCISHAGKLQYFLELLYNRIFIRFDFTRHFIRSHFNFITTEEKIWNYFNWNITWKFIKVSLLGTYFFIILFWLPSRDKIVGFISVFGLIFFLSVVIQSHKLISYSYLLVPLAAINIRRFICPTVKIKLFYVGLYAIIWFFGRRYLL